MKTKEELQKELREIETREVEDKVKKEKEKNYEQFKKREPDMVIGKAHADIGITKIDYDWYHGRFFTIGDAISIHGNCGTSYNARAPITSSTHTYFHNVWSDKQRHNFQAALNKVAIKEVKKIMSDLRCVLEIMGLQSENFFIQNIYPEDKKEEIMKEIESERAKVLDNYKDKDFLRFIKKQTGWKQQDGTPVPEYIDVDNLSHSRMILMRYIFKHRPKLQNRFMKCRIYQDYKEKNLK